MNKTIYRVEIWCSEDADTEHWSYFPLSSFYANKEEVEKELEKFSKLSKNELERITGFVGDNRPKIMEYEVIID